ncbi:MAG: hypothetical protein JO212_01420 [Acetobacteraceae bacterium]|nr:hypothetical protein [Acetobacteraceae bacterium]MBV8588723.1 hypothetical protein [Acetobacteraceae bacterium]
MTEYEFVHHQGWREIGNETRLDLGNGCIAIVVRDAEGYWPITTNATATAWRCADHTPRRRAPGAFSTI